MSKEIRGKIKSIKSTQKITKAMQLVAASKIRKAQRRMFASLAYAKKIRTVIGHVANSKSQYYQHHFLQVHPTVRRVGIIVISSDRGLCGGLNVNLFKHLLTGSVKDWHDRGIGIDLCLINNKAINFFKRLPFNIVASVAGVGKGIPSIYEKLIGSIRAMLDLYDQKELDQLYVVFNEFVNTMTQRPVVEQLLPLVVSEDESKGHIWDYLYEPDAAVLLDTLLRRYLESQIYQAIVDNMACEEAARMVAMKSAADNAAQLIDDLQLVYNKTRQAAITQEISEVVAGAEASL
jgi:F-type H+-transporting ATPase subunit gamma